ncbi:MAG: ribosome silencing factor [Bacteroidales bacterium]|jgi:ribosome-associated protein|nr:ribosome silencing factor [Bacteroidales bacterium]
MITHDLRVIADAMLDKKGQNVVSLDLRSIGTAISDYFIVCNADSTTNVKAIADNIVSKMEEHGEKLYKSQGEENSFWIIQDYGNIIVHIFLTEYREFYRLEDLWADAPKKNYRMTRKTTRTETSEK